MATEAEIAQRRQQIVEAAYEVFLTKGYHAAAIADIAAQVGTGHGTIYRYFDNKRDILDHVVDMAVERIMSSLSLYELSTATSKADFRVQATRLGDGLFTQIIDADRRLPRLLVLEASAVDAEMLHRLLGLMETVVATIAFTLEDIQRSGYLPQGLQAEPAARALLGTAVAALLGEAKDPGLSAADRRRYVDTVVSLLCDNSPGDQ